MTIVFGQILPSYIPTVQVETDWTSGLSQQPSTDKKILIIGHKTSAGTATNNLVTAINGLNDAIAKYGKGSDIAVMAEMILKNNPMAEMYGFCYAEAGGGVVGTGTVTLTGTASGTGVLKVWVCGKLFTCGISSTNTPTQIGDAIAAEINADPNLPVVAVNSTGTVALNCRTKGPHGNSIRYRCEITSGITTTAVATGAVFASGATAGTLSLTNAEGNEFGLYVLHTTDSVVLAALEAHIAAQSLPSAAKPGIGIVASTDTYANTASIVSGKESYRYQCVWSQQNDQGVLYLAGAFAGLRSSKEPNISLDDTEIKGILPPYNETVWPTNLELNNAVKAGITPIRPLKSGSCQVVRSVVAKLTTPAFRDHMIIEIADYTARYLQDLVSLRCKGRPLKTGSEPRSSTTVTLQRILAVVNEGLLDLDDRDYLQGVQSAIDAGLHIAEVNAEDPTRVDVAYRFWPVGSVHSIMMRQVFVTSGN